MYSFPTDHTQSPAGFDNDTLLNPDGIDRTLAHTVVRDNGAHGISDDWFTLCGLDKLNANSISFIGLFLDESGSMDRYTVENSYTEFLADLANAGVAISEVFNRHERWIDPFLTTLAPGAAAGAAATAKTPGMTQEEIDDACGTGGIFAYICTIWCFLLSLLGLGC